MRQLFLEALLSDYLKEFEDEGDRIAPLFQAFRDPNVMKRCHSPGHITATGILLSRDSMLLIQHPGLDCLLPPGGHVESGEQPKDAVLREVWEEVGVRCRAHEWHESRAFPFDIDIHQIPENADKNEPAHLHYDFRYIVMDTQQVRSRAELPNLWIPLNEVCGSGMVRLRQKIRNRVWPIGQSARPDV